MTEEMKAMIELVNQALKEVEPMSKADKMFKVMGYEKTLDDDYNIFYEKYFAPIQCTETIAFIRKYKMVEISYDKDNIVASIQMDAHLAVHDKLKYLGWLENE